MRKLLSTHSPTFLCHSILLVVLTKLILNENTKSYAFISTTIKPNTKLTKPTLSLISPFLFQHTKLYGKLWDRLEIEERDEIGWYLLNCVVGNELALKSQVELVLADFSKEDVEQISVPTSKSLRSHGKRHVVDDIVLYPGYVFVKIRLGCDVYEAIQSCTLCRSFMGTIRMKGMYSTLPSIPTMLSPEEVDEFKGLETKLQTENEEQKATNEQMLQPYKGYEVGQMVKVTNGQFKGEDGVIKRLKNLKIGVRLFTYGSNYDVWFEPDDIRLLNDVESLRGLSGPDKPIYNRQFQEIVNPEKYKKEERENAKFTRDSSGRNFRSVFGSGGAKRNRKQDRVNRGDKFYSREEDRERQEKRSWESYKRKQQYQEREKNSSYDIERAMSHEDGEDYNSDWMSPTRPTSSSRSNIDNALDFLNDIMMESSTTSSQHETKEIKEKTKDDFFNTLLEDFDNSFGDSKNNNQYSSSNANRNQEEDDFFATLEQEMLSSSPYENKKTSPKKDKIEELYKDDDDSFTFLEHENQFKDIKNGDQELQILEYDGSKPQEELLSNNAFKDDDADLLSDTGADDDFFNSLNLDDLYSTAPTSKDEINDTSARSKDEKSNTRKHPASSNDNYNESTLQKFTVDQLKEELRNKNLKVSGKKSDLIQRLLSS